MALADWVIHTAGVDAPTIDIDSATPIADAKSLSIAQGAGSFGYGGGNVHLDSGSFDLGLTDGKIRTIHRTDYGNTIFNQFNMHAGLYCMSDQEDISNVTGSCYYMAFGSTNTAGSYRRSVWKMNAAGLAHAGSTTVLFDDLMPGGSVGAGKYWPIELEWHASLADYGGTLLICRMGTRDSEDFGTLADFFSVVHTASPLLTSSGEGIMARKGDTDNVPGVAWTLDTTTVTNLTKI